MARGRDTAHHPGVHGHADLRDAGQDPGSPARQEHPVDPLTFESVRRSTRPRSSRRSTIPPSATLPRSSRRAKGRLRDAVIAVIRQAVEHPPLGARDVSGFMRWSNAVRLSRDTSCISKPMRFLRYASSCLPAEFWFAATFYRIREANMGRLVLPRMFRPSRRSQLRAAVQSIERVFLDRLLRIGQWEIATGVPERHQIRIVGTARLTALAGRIDGDRSIPVAGVEDLSIARALDLFPRSPSSSKPVAFTVYSSPGLGSGPRSNNSRLPGLLVESVAEADRVELAPRPRAESGPQVLLEFLARRPDGIAESEVSRAVTGSSPNRSLSGL